MDIDLRGMIDDQIIIDESHLKVEEGIDTYIRGLAHEKINTKSYSEYADICGLILDELLESYGMKFIDLENNAERMVLENAVVNQVLYTYKLEPTYGKRQTLEKEYIKEYGYDSTDDFINDNGLDYLNDEINRIIALDYIYTIALTN